MKVAMYLVEMKILLDAPHYSHIYNLGANINLIIKHFSDGATVFCCGKYQILVVLINFNCFNLALQLQIYTIWHVM